MNKSWNLFIANKKRKFSSALTATVDGKSHKWCKFVAKSDAAVTFFILIQLQAAVETSHGWKVELQTTTLEDNVNMAAGLKLRTLRLDDCPQRWQWLRSTAFLPVPRSPAAPLTVLVRVVYSCCWSFWSAALGGRIDETISTDQLMVFKCCRRSAALFLCQQRSSPNHHDLLNKKTLVPNWSGRLRWILAAVFRIGVGVGGGQGSVVSADQFNTVLSVKSKTKMKLIFAWIAVDLCSCSSAGRAA